MLPPFRFFRQIVVGVFVLAAAAFAGCTTQPERIEPPVPAAGEVADRPVYVASHGWHTGIIVEARVLNDAVPGIREKFSRHDWYEIGWGDKGFYMANEITTGLTFRAMFWSAGSVLHVVAFDGPPEKYFNRSDVRRLALYPSHEHNLIRFLQNSFVRDASGSAVFLRDGIYGESRFFAGVGSYGLANTCNKWSAKALYSGGLDISTAFKLTASSVMDALPDES